MPDPFPYKSQLEKPVIGLESEFKVFIDDVESLPENVWRTPAGLVDRPLLKRTNKSLQLPTGGALYFDGGVIEVVTPVIEIARQCTARAVRSLWEQIEFLREQLDRWEAREGRRARLQAAASALELVHSIVAPTRASHGAVLHSQSFAAAVSSLRLENSCSVRSMTHRSPRVQPTSVKIAGRAIGTVSSRCLASP